MTEVVVDSANQPNNGAANAQPVNGGAGQLLRQAREQQQMSVQTLAATLKVPVYKLEALEADRWDVLTDSVFTRSLALSVCRLLQIPTEPVLAGLPKYEAAKLAKNPEGINAPFKEKSLPSLMSSSQDSGSGNVVKIVAALLIAVAGGVGLYFLPQWQSETEDVAVVNEGEAVAEPMVVPQAPVEAAAPQVSETLAVETTTPAAEKAVEAVTTTAPVVSVESAPEAESVAAPTAAATGNGPALRFTATGESWVQVRDAQDKVVMEKILKAGDVYAETAPSRPLKVVVGNAGATTLEVDGAALNLLESARNNVARIEVK